MDTVNNNVGEDRMDTSVQRDHLVEESMWIEHCQQGQMEDFGQIYDTYVRRIYDFIYFKTHHKETAEDLCSKVFMKCLENIQSYNRTQGTFNSWIYRIATNTVIDHYRTQKSHSGIEDAWDIASGDDLMRDVENQEKFLAVEKYMRDLKSEQRDIIMMRIWSGMSYQEIADIIGKSEDNCKMIFSRAIGKMRKDVIIGFLAYFFMN